MDKHLEQFARKLAQDTIKRSGELELIIQECRNVQIIVTFAN